MMMLQDHINSDMNVQHFHAESQDQCHQAKCWCSDMQKLIVMPDQDSYLQACVLALEVI